MARSVRQLYTSGAPQEVRGMALMGEFILDVPSTTCIYPKFAKPAFQFWTNFFLLF